MLPHFNSHLQNPNNQLQLNGANGSAPHQVMGNQGNLGQMNPQFQAGMLNNPQLPMQQFANPNPFFAPNQFFPFPQGAFQNLNANNLPQPFAPNAVNPAQFMPTWPLNVPNLVQNVSQLLQMQMMNVNPQNLGLFMNAQAGGVLPQPVNGNGLMHMNQQPVNGNGLTHMNQQTVNGNGLTHMNQQPGLTHTKHNDAVNKDTGFNQPQRNWDAFAPGSAESQNNAGVVNDVNDRKNNWRKPHDKNFNGNHKNNESQRGFGNKQFPHRQNAQGNFKYNNENRGRGNKIFGGKNFNSSNLSEQNQVGKKRSIALNYTEQEIQLWREQRRKNFPSQANVEKKLQRNPKQPEVIDEATKIRRQQLKEILAKQAELGCEVAEIPPCYLSDHEQQTDGKKVFGKRDRFPNKFDKRGKFQRGDRFSKRQRYENNQTDNLPKRPDFASRGTTNLQTEPSLLKKLLSSEIKKDKKHLLQVFRFMVANKFFENWPEKPLEFPVVIVKEAGNEHKSDVIEDDASNGLATLENDVVSTGDYDDSCSVEADDQDKNAAEICTANYADADEEEEGEIL